MPWEHRINSDLNMIEVSYTGKVTADDLHESTSIIIKLEKETGIHKILTDTSEAISAVTLSDLYDIPTKQYLEEAADREGHLAIILSKSPKEKEAAEFFQIVCRNGGWQVQTFADRQSAIDWLQSDH
jgi:hypothetical protein